MFLLLCLTSLSVTVSQSIHAAANGIISFFLTLSNNIPLPSLHGKQMEKQWEQWLTLFFWAPVSLQMVIAAMKLKDAYSLEGKL